MQKSRQILRREARENAKLESLKLPTFSGQNRRIRRMATQIVSTVGNNRKTTRGRDIHYQYIYNIVDDKNNKILSFSTSKCPLSHNILPYDVQVKLNAFLAKKKKVINYKVVLKTIKHKQHSLTFVKVMELVLKLGKTL